MNWRKWWPIVSNVPLISFFAYAIAKNWVAGKTMDELLRDSGRANSKGLKVIANYLGEEITKRDEVEKTAKEYLRLIDSISLNCIDGSISTKLTQLGLNIDKEYCRATLERIVDHAGRTGRLVWVDMESSRFTDDTLDIYTSLLSKGRDVGICIQSYLKRSEQDVERLVEMGAKIRLVKGAYNEPARIAYKSRSEVGKNYLRLMEYLFRNSRELFAVATHDDKLVHEAIGMGRRYGGNFEFSMLKGVRDRLKLELVEKGYRVTEYIPYGERWLPYSLRRIREKPSNVLLLARSLISR